MELTTKGRYAVMAMADLAARGQDVRAVTLGEIAQRQAISQSYLEQLFARLRRAGLVAGMRGPGGGYRLARRAEDISVAEIVSAADETIKATACTAGAELGCQGRRARCITHDLWAELTLHIDAFLSEVSLADVVADRVRGRAALPVGAATLAAAE